MFFKLDSHQHFWKYDPVKYSWINESMSEIRRDFLPKDLKPILEKHKFNGCIAVQADQSEEETEFLLQLASQHDFIKGVVGWIDLSAENVEERLMHFATNQLFKGIRHTEWDEKGEFMLKPSFLKGISLLEKLQLSYDVLVFEYQLEAAVVMISKFPNQKFVLNHMGKPSMLKKPSEDWKMQMRKLAAHEHAYCKISGIFSEVKASEINKDILFFFLDFLIQTFGTHRIMFGSDWPVCRVFASYTDVLHLLDNYFSSFSESEKNSIFGNNAAQFYNIQNFL